MVDFLNLHKAVIKSLPAFVPGLAIVATQSFAVAIAPDGASDATAGHYDAVPPLLTNTTPPLVMLVMSNDHQLFVKAYSDYSDLDGDKTLDKSYNDSFEYYGYFNSDKCYDYSTASGTFQPNGDVVSGHKCSNQWSGNLLNWASMTRIDIVRKVLYGGKRVVDDAENNTVLERAMIPNDVHSFVKVVDSSEIDGSVSDYTPFSNSEISICNTTIHTGGVDNDDEANKLNTVLNPPLLRVAEGKYPQWATAEITQCVYDGEGSYGSSSGSRPPIGDALTDGALSGSVTNGNYIARVEVCVDGKDDDASYCRSYDDASANITVKPTGLLQEHGETGDLNFGLMTGSYKNNTEGGVLRKNITQFVGGAATSNEIDLDTGVFTGNDNSVVGAIDSMRVAGWDFGSSRYTDCNRHSIPIATVRDNTTANEECRDWGNPLSEIYLEALRYFSGTASAAFAIDDSDYVAGMNQATWNASTLMDTENACADCAIIVLSTGLNSFDADDLATPSADLPGLSGLADIVAKTKDVGVEEGYITGQNFIIGNADGTNADNVCDTKSFSANGLGDVLGLCPEIPQMEGSYHIAGLAYHARNTDLRTGLVGDQKVTTYTVALAESLPSFEIETGTNTVSFVPSCQASTDSGAAIGAGVWNDCSLSDVTVVEQTSTYGHILVAWEDSHWGNDYDMDGISSIEYCTASGSADVVQAACPSYATNGNLDADDDEVNAWGAATDGQIQMRVSVPVAAAANALSFGFIMNGSMSDNTYINLLRPGNQTINQLNGQNTGTILWDSVRLFTSDASTGDVLKNPLWYAAKYGAYDELDDKSDATYGSPNNDSGSSDEWDVENNLTGASGADGVPDAFFQVTNPSKLEENLATIFADVSGNANSSAAAAVVANSAGGTGAIYQAVYEPEVIDDSNRRVEWIGTVMAYFIDQDSQLREDNDGDGQLDSTDKAFVLGFNALDEPVFTREGSTDELPFMQLRTIWDAAEELGKISDADVVNQRDYEDSAGGGRHIKTWIDGYADPAKDNGVVDAGEYIDFDASTFSGALTDTVETTYEPRRFLGFDSGEDVVGGNDYAEGLVNFIRGQDQPFIGWRSRQLDRNDSGVITHRLGDIVHSAPLVVGAPKEDYKSRYHDSTYAAYQDRWKNRREVVYVGANDGMLHAFNAGFFDPATYKFLTESTDEDGNSLEAHPLGSELWAYVPQSMLPHLQWLKESSFQHVYYVDGEVQAFDVNIFEDSDTHPFGWGTIIVATMRLGGGDITIDPNSDSDDADADDINDKTMRSSVVIFDVTDPESEPVLLAELSHEQLGYTTSKPTVIKSRPVDSGGDYDDSVDKWVLVFGSGPAGSDGATKQAALDQGLSNQTARMFAADISDSSAIAWIDFDSGDDSPVKVITPAISNEVNSYVGDLSSADWNVDYIDDVVYFGTVGKDVADGLDSGHLFRMVPATGFNVSGAVFSQLLGGGAVSDSSQPFSSAPLPVLDRSGVPWVFAGAGRLLVSDDIKTEQQLSYHGIIEPRDANGNLTYATVDKDDLINSTDILVFLDGGIAERGDSTSPGVDVKNGAGNDASVSPTNEIATYSALRSYVPAQGKGWYMDLGAESDDIVRRERNLLSATKLSNMLLFDEYTASGESCDADGSSKLMALSIFTGTPSPDLYFETDPSTVNNNGEARILTGKDLGKKPIVGISVHNKKVLTQQGSKISSNDPTFGGVPFGRRSWREITYER